MKGAEERELVLGRLLGISALALSGRLRSDAANAEGALKVNFLVPISPENSLIQGALLTA